MRWVSVEEITWACPSPVWYWVHTPEEDDKCRMAKTKKNGEWIDMDFCHDNEDKR